ncbi:MAG TPA: SRPBCC family protein [Acidimicrobiales bacterium]
MADVAVSMDVVAPAERVWELVADVTRMGEWSPETTGCRWLGGATDARPGNRFRGSNQRGARRWSTVATVAEAEPGRLFSFDVSSLGLAVARWTYRIEPVGDERCTVTEEWADHRNRLVHVAGSLLTGVSDRAEHNRASMESTLGRLKQVAEAV